MKRSIFFSFAVASLVTTSLLGMQSDAGTFGWSGAEYDKVSGGQFQAGLMLYNQYFKVDGPVKVLEVGAGTGRFAAWLAQQLPKGSCVVGVDNNQSMIDEALRKQTVEPLENLEFQLKDARELKHDLGFYETFDVVTSIFCLHWIPNEQEMADTMKGIAQSLKPGGKFVAIANIHDNPEHPVVLHQAAQRFMSSEKWSQYYEGKMVLGNEIPLSKYKQIIADAGLKGDAFVVTPPARNISEDERNASLLAIPFGQVIPEELRPEFLQEMHTILESIDMKNDDGTYKQTIPCIVIVAEKDNS